MRGLDVSVSCQIRNRARQLYASRAMITTRRQVELTHAQHDVAARIRL